MADIPRPSESQQSGKRLGLLILLMVLAGGVGSFLLARRIWWLPPVASQQGIDVDRLFTITLIVTGIAFIIVHLALGIFAWRYADRGQPSQRAFYWHDNRTLELTWTLVPAAVLVTLISMGAVVWTRVHSAPPADAMVVDVRAVQFGWMFRYPGPDGQFGRAGTEHVKPDTNPFGVDPADPAGADDIVTRELHIVLREPVQVRMTSHDVIHSFFLPNFRVKQDVVPGMFTTVWFVPTASGKFEIACAELCGVGHYIMRNTVTVEPTKAAFDAWLAAQKK
ncbi:MAG: cytochrome c oxidase subunit II [bacterium]